MSLQDVLVDSLWTPYVKEVINDNVEYESIYYHFTDESTLIPGYSAWTRSFIADVNAAIDLDFVETSDINISTIDFIETSKAFLQYFPSKPKNSLEEVQSRREKLGLLAFVG